MLQIVYHASGYLDLVAQSGMKFGDPLDVCVPTGNFGNILAAFYAKVLTNINKTVSLHTCTALHSVSMHAHVEMKDKME